MQSCLLVTDIPFWYLGLGQCLRIQALIEALFSKCQLSVCFLGKQEGFVSKLPIHFPFDFKAFDVSNSFERVQFIGYLKENACDIAIIEYLHLEWVTDLLPESTLKILDTHDLAYMRSYQLKEKGYIQTVEWTKEQEKAIYDKFDYVMFIQSKEAEVASRWIKASRCLVCPHPAVVTKGYALDESQKEVRFLASPSHVNCDGVRWLHDQVLPYLEPKIPIGIYGAICLNQALVEQCPHLAFQGTVSDLKAFYHSTALFINPVQFGTGIKIKMIEALSYGVPVLSTHSGAYGLEKNNAVRLADRPIHFANQIKEIIHSPLLRTTLSSNAYAFTQKFHHPDDCFAPLFQLFQT